MSGQHYRSGFTILRSVTLSRIFTAIRWLSYFHLFYVVEVDDKTFSPLFISIHLPQLLYPSYEASWHGGRTLVPSMHPSAGICKAFFTPILPIGNHPGSLAVQNTFNPFLSIVLCTGCYSCVLLRGTGFDS